MTHAAYVFSGYLVTAAVLAAYAGWIVSRSRSLRRALTGEGRDREDAAGR